MCATAPENFVGVELMKCRLHYWKPQEKRYDEHSSKFSLSKKQRFNRPVGFGVHYICACMDQHHRVCSMCKRRGIVLPERQKPKDSNRLVACMVVRGPFS